MYATAHRYLTWGGNLLGGEEWQCGLRLAPPTTVTYADGAQTTGFSALVTAVQSFHSRSQTSIALGCTLTWAKVAVLDRDGHYVTAPAIHEFASPVPGGAAGTTFVHPPQIAVVASLRTGTSFGDAQRGRFYIPMPYVSIKEDGCMGATDATEIATSVKTFLVAINTAIGQGALGEKVSVMSIKGNGTTRAVTEVRVGRALDTQRRRRAGLIEDYKSVSLAA